MQYDFDLMVERRWGYSNKEKDNDLSYWMTSDSVCNYETNKETIQKALELFKDIHRMFGDIAPEMIGEKTILGQAYENACLAWNRGDYGFSIPSSRCYYCHLRTLIQRYENHGWYIDPKWKEAIY